MKFFFSILIKMEYFVQNTYCKKKQLNFSLSIEISNLS